METGPVSRKLDILTRVGKHLVGKNITIIGGDGWRQARNEKVTDVVIYPEGICFYFGDEWANYEVGRGQRIILEETS